VAKQKIVSFVDNSGGLWGKLLFSNEDIQEVIWNAINNRKLFRYFADEMVSSVKGGPQHSFTITRKNDGKLRFARFATGSYPYGIAKRLSPDGSQYEPLKKSTLRHREWKAKVGELPTNRRGSFILRETSEHIFYGLKITNKTITDNSANFEIGWTGENQNIALKQNSGFNTGKNEWFGKDPKSNMKVPARPFIGIQKQCIDNLKTAFGKIIR